MATWPRRYGSSRWMKKAAGTRGRCRARAEKAEHLAAAAHPAAIGGTMTSITGNSPRAASVSFRP